MKKLILRGVQSKVHDVCFSVSNEMAKAVIDVKVFAEIEQPTKHGLITYVASKPVHMLCLAGFASKTCAFRFADFFDCGKPLKGAPNKKASINFLIEFTSDSGIEKQIERGPIGHAVVKLANA